MGYHLFGTSQNKKNKIGEVTSEDIHISAPEMIQPLSIFVAVTGGHFGGYRIYLAELSAFYHFDDLFNFGVIAVHIAELNGQIFLPCGVEQVFIFGQSSACGLI